MAKATAKNPTAVIAEDWNGTQKAKEMVRQAHARQVPLDATAAMIAAFANSTHDAAVKWIRSLEQTEQRITCSFTVLAKDDLDAQNLVMELVKLAVETFPKRAWKGRSIVTNEFVKLIEASANGATVNGAPIAKEKAAK
jgi:hypothetical protein